MANQVFHYSNIGVSSGQRFYLKDEVSGLYLNNLNIISDSSIEGNNLVYKTGNQTISGIKTFGQNSNIYNSTYSHILGGIDNIISGVAGTIIVGGSGNSASGNYCFIGGGRNNIIEEYIDSSTIGGGHNNTIISSSDWSTIGGGQLNRIFNQYCSIGGGNDNQAIGYASTIGGGQSNTANGNYSTVNGTVNLTYANYSIIGGGTENIANINAVYGTICGGYSNLIHENSSFIGGGSHNKASGICSSVVGGNSNSASGNYSFVGGGVGNTTIGQYSNIAGGSNNTASGDYSSIVGGRKAKIAQLHSGAGVWADGQDRDHNSRGEHSCSLDFASGVYLRLPQFTGSSSQIGNIGELKVSGSGLYICTGINLWGRTFISTF